MVKFHFLNVGSGDCTIVHFPPRIIPQHDGSVSHQDERIMMMDLHHHENHEEYTNIINYYKNNFRTETGNVKPIFRFICSHPHYDHIRGISQLFNDAQISILNFWDLAHEFEPENFDRYEGHEEDWKVYKQKGDPNNKPPTTIITYREDPPRNFWHQGEDRITVLAPSKELIRKAHYTDEGKKKDPVEIDEMSYAILIRVNNIKVILAGDGKERTWNDIYEHCKGDIAESRILKAGHHGQESAFHKDAVKLMNPDYIIFSNSQEEDLEHGAAHLYKETVPRTNIYKTCGYGTIIAECDFNGDINFYTAP